MRFCIATSCLLFVISSSSSCFGQFIVAHRGASYDAPENTLAAFRLAWERGADAIEGDFYLTSDGKIVCIHDKTTGRVAPDQSELTVAKSTIEQLWQLDVGRWKDEKFAGERIPTLEEVLANVPKGKRIFVEIKCGPEIVPTLQKQLAASGLNNQQGLRTGSSILPNGPPGLIKLRQPTSRAAPKMISSASRTRSACVRIERIAMRK